MLYKFNQLQIGIKLASGTFKQGMKIMVTRSEFDVAYFDNILIKSEYRAQPTEHMEMVSQNQKTVNF